MPRLSCSYSEFIQIIAANGFVLHRHDGTSHQRWRREFQGNVFYVDVAPHRAKDAVPLGTLQSMIRQSGLPKSRFRKQPTPAAVPAVKRAKRRL